MKKFRWPVLLWSIASLAVLCGVLAVLQCGLTAKPAVIVRQNVITDTAAKTLECVCSGDTAALKKMLAGSPRIKSAPEGKTEAMLWDAYLDSIHYYSREEVTAEGEYLELDVTIECLDLPALMDAAAVQAEKLAAAHPENYPDSPTAAADAFHDAAAKILAGEPQTRTEEIRMRFVRDGGHWQAMLTPGLQQLLSGFLE